MVLLKNVSEAKFINILKPIADVCIEEDQKEYIDFESFHTHTICHECCHGIGPHTIVLPSGEQSTVRMGLLPKTLLRSMYVSFFGMLSINMVWTGNSWVRCYGCSLLFLCANATYYFLLQIEAAVESLSREILKIQAKANKAAAILLLQKYAKLTQPLQIALGKLEEVQMFQSLAKEESTSALQEPSPSTAHLGG